MTSLKRLNTGYIDLYHGVHGLSDPGQLTGELEQWAKDAKKRKLIRFFGFSTHKNMARVLAAASKLDWIDAIATSYNFRFMQDDKLQAAVDACHQAGIGLIAIKTQGHGQKIPWGRNKDAIETEEDKRLVGHFLQRGFTEAQAKIKVVLEDERFSSVCVGMENVAILASDVAAALDRIKGPPLVEVASGKAMVETYMVLYDRESRPVSSVIVGRLKDGSRFLARSEPDEETLTALTEQEPIGSWGKVTPRDGYNTFVF